MIIVINGSARAGKDSFYNLVKQEFRNMDLSICCQMSSTVDFVKVIASECGWDGQKTPENRKFLSDLKDLLTRWGDVPYQKVYDAYSLWKHYWESDLYDLNKCVFFVMCREPEEIQKFVDRLDAKTLLIRREVAEFEQTSNHADANVLNYNYDFTIENNGTLEDLQHTARDFVDKIMEGRLYDAD